MKTETQQQTHERLLATIPAGEAWVGLLASGLLRLVTREGWWFEVHFRAEQIPWESERMGRFYLAALYQPAGEWVEITYDAMSSLRLGVEVREQYAIGGSRDPRYFVHPEDVPEPEDPDGALADRLENEDQT